MAFDPPRRVEAPKSPGDSPRDLLVGVDRSLRGRVAESLGGQSPWAAMQAWEDWAFHLAMSPGYQAELAWRWSKTLSAIGQRALRRQADPFLAPLEGDRRFRSEGWSGPPFNLLAQMHLALEDQWRCATSSVRGVTDHHARRVAFMGQFLLNAVAPVNFPWTNPDVLARFAATGGGNFMAGMQLLADDAARLARGERLKGLEAWTVGKTLAVTPGKVVFRSGFFELLQYEPATPSVHREPILIVPAWIMKYYILDLSAEESLVRWLTARGFTVFIMSWKNPGPEMRNAAFDDYRSEGIMTALDAVNRIVPKEKVHAVGYCLGGTALALAAAAMNRDGDDRLASLTLLAAQTDFEEAGELLLFVDESQVALLEDMMNVTGYLDARRMAGAFYALRANELLFARFIERYLLGEPSEPKSLDAWLSDPTRMPERMHSEYLRRLFMNNSFAHGLYEIDGAMVSLKDIRTPVFVLGADRDHIAPWRSVFKIQLYGSADTTFVLTGGGHNSSVVSPPGKRGAYFQAGHSPAHGGFVDPDRWRERAPQQSGSWWPYWLEWLAARSSSDQVRPRRIGNAAAGLKPLCDAPGAYVFET